MKVVTTYSTGIESNHYTTTWLRADDGMTMHEHLVFERPNAKYPRARRTEQVITYRREGGFDDEHDKYIDGLMPSRGPIKIVGSAITEADVAVGGILCNEEAVPYHTPEERQTLVEIRAAIAKLAG